jgi:hypothetical protein
MHSGLGSGLCREAALVLISLIVAGLRYSQRYSLRYNTKKYIRHCHDGHTSKMFATQVQDIFVEQSRGTRTS